MIQYIIHEGSEINHYKMIFFKFRLKSGQAMTREARVLGVPISFQNPGFSPLVVVPNLRQGQQPLQGSILIIWFKVGSWISKNVILSLLI